MYEYCSVQLAAAPLSDIDFSSDDDPIRFTIAVSGEEMRMLCQQDLDEQAAEPGTFPGQPRNSKGRSFCDLVVGSRLFLSSADLSIAFDENQDAAGCRIVLDASPYQDAEFYTEIGRHLSRTLPDEAPEESLRATLS